MAVTKEKPVAVATPATEVKPIKLSLPLIATGAINYTGEQINTKVPRLEVPEIRVSYKAEDDPDRVAPKGEFVQFDPNSKLTTTLGKKITIQILHHRQALSSYKLGDTCWTPEISMQTKVASLFFTPKKDPKTGKRGKTQFLMRGEIKKGAALRTQYPDLGYLRILYVLHEGRVKRLVVKGASFSQFIDLTNELKGASSASVILDLTTSKEKEGTVIYYPIHFTIAGQTDMTVLEPTLKQLAEWFKKLDVFVAETNASRAEAEKIARGDGDPAAYAKEIETATAPEEGGEGTLSEQMKAEKDGEDGEDPIDLKDIPF